MVPVAGGWVGGGSGTGGGGGGVVVVVVVVPVPVPVVVVPVVPRAGGGGDAWWSGVWTISHEISSMLVVQAERPESFDKNPSPHLSPY